MGFELLDARVARLAQARFTTPTEIQEKVFPIAMGGSDCLAIAPTGFGKMEAAFLPLLSKLLQASEEKKKTNIFALYITPLKALNRDMIERMTHWCRLLGVSLAVRHGDNTSTERARQRDSPPQLMVTTPESLGSLLVAPKLKESLANTRFVVVDEVHELVDSKRGSQLSLSLERLKKKCGSLQLIGLSATVGDEEKVAKFLSQNAIVVKAELSRKILFSVEFPLKAEKEIGEMWKLDDAANARIARLLELIDSSTGTLVFVNTRSLAESLASMLFQLKEVEGKISVHHGSLSKEARIQAEQDFKSAQKVKAIICTSSLELGIDIGSVQLVVQYHSPRQVSRLLQRVGRSGHSRHLVPKGVILSVNALDAAESGVLCKCAAERKLEAPKFFEKPLDVLAHQLVGIALDANNEPVPVAEAFSLCKKAFPFRELSLQEFVEVCKQLKDERLIFLSADYAKFTTTRASLMYYYENLSTIRDSKKFFMKNSESRRNVALLDEQFVAENLQEGVSFICRGIPWKVLSVSDDEVVVEQSSDYSAAIPDWIGEEIPVSFDACQQVAELLQESCKEKLDENYCLDGNAQQQIASFSSRQKQFFVPKKEQWFIEEGGNTLVLHTFAGNKVNETLSRVVAGLFNASGASVRTRASSYSIAFEASKKVSAEKLRDVLLELTPGNVEKILFKTLPSTAMFRYRFVDVAKRFGFLSKKSDLRDIALKRLVESQKETPIWKEAMAETLTEKLDLQKLQQLVQHKKITIVSKTTLSPLAQEFLEFYAGKELLGPAEPTDALVEAFKKNLLKEKTEFYCVFCKHCFSRRNSELPESLKCPSCSSTQLTLQKYQEILEKNSAELSGQERKRLNESRKIESLFSSFGKKAVVALTTFGVGAETAGRVLSRLRKSDEEFYIDLLEAQKNFIKNRKFWRV